MFPKPEAQLFADVARRCGVPDEAILIEDKSTNTGMAQECILLKASTVRWGRTAPENPACFNVHRLCALTPACSASCINPGENCRFSQELLVARGIPGRDMIVVQKPFMERRALLTVGSWHCRRTRGLPNSQKKADFR